MHEVEHTPRKVYLSPEDLAERITPEQLTVLLEHQEAAFQRGKIIDEPLPITDDSKLLEAFTDFAENREIYDEHKEIEQAIDNDPILQALRPQDPSRDTKPEQSRAIRIRASLVAARCVLDRSIKLELAS